MKSTFPAIYSTLCPLALSSLISANYGLSGVNCKLLVRGVGDTYLVETNLERYILRVYRSLHRKLPQIREEVSLLLALKSADVSVSYPLATGSGELILNIDAAEGERHAVLFTYARGRVEKLLNDKQLAALGQEMARFHHVSAATKLGDERWSFDLDTTLYEPLEVLRSVFTEDTENYEWIRHTGMQAAQKLSEMNTSGFFYGYCHFDFLPKNFHFENEVVTFFDFDFMGRGWLVNDIMSFWQHIALEIYTGRMTKEAGEHAYDIFLSAYRSIRPVSKEELAAVPYLSIGFWLFYMAFHTTHDQFHGFSQPAHLKSYVGILKHIVETYW